MRTMLLIGLCSLAAACSPERESTRPTVGPIVDAVYASGLVRSRDQYEASAVVSGVLAKRYVEVGDSVSMGDPLFRIDDRSSALLTRNAESVYELARRNGVSGSPILKERTLAVQLAKERLENDSLLYVRQRSLWEQKVGAKVEYEQRELAFRTARTAYANARAALEDTRNQLRNNLEVARNNLLNNQAMKDDHLVRSLIDGRVYELLIEPGELVTPQQKLAVLGSAKDFEMELQVDEFDIARVRKGQEVQVTLDSYRGEVFEGEVSRVDPLMDPRSRTFTVKAVFTNMPGTLYPNLTVEANIVVDRKGQALTIPAEYLVNGAYVITGKGDSTAVKIGLRDLQRVEVLSGIDSATVILKP